MSRASHWTRPPLDQDRPDRRARNFYRSAASGGAAVAGVPLRSTEDAVVAAVRLAYGVADAQIERSRRLAARLRTAADRAVGPRGDRQAVDAAEQLVFKTFLSGLGWMEGLAAAEDESPLRRLAAAQYRLLGRVLGLADGGAAGDGAVRPPSSAAESRARPPAGAARAGEAPRAASRVPLEIVHRAEPEDRRAVIVEAWELRARTVETTRIVFHAEERAGSGLEASFRKDLAGARIELPPTRGAAPGRWLAAICDPSGVQIGWIAIRL